MRISALVTVGGLLVAVSLGGCTGPHPQSLASGAVPRCAARLDAAINTGPGPSDLLVPGTPTMAVRCEYGTDPSDLVASNTLTVPQAKRLATALNALIPDPCKCVHGGTPSPGHNEVVYFGYQDRAIFGVNGAIGANLDTWTNQKRTVANYSSSIVALLNQLTS